MLGESSLQELILTTELSNAWMEIKQVKWILKFSTEIEFWKIVDTIRIEIQVNIIDFKMEEVLKLY